MNEIVTRPWGEFQVIDKGKDFLVKRIYVKPKSRFSLQYHFHRSEIWTVVNGRGLVELYESIKVYNDKNPMMTGLFPGNSITIGVKQIHRMKSYEDGVEFIEVQCGKILEETDICRLEDDWHRI